MNSFNKRELAPRSYPSTAWLLLVPCLAWAFFSWVSSANLDSQNDMLENYAWSQPLLMGTHKHPPFFSWVVGIWFAVFPESDWAYRLLSYVNVAVGIAGVIVLGRRLGLGNLATWGGLLLLWAFPYSTLAGKFNANTQLLSVWPWAAAMLLASWQEKGWRGIWFSVWLGLTAAACMLSKYYSGLFLVGFLFPIFLNAQGRQWLLTPRPYVALLVFGLALLPHVMWMASYEWAPITYATNKGDGQVVWPYVWRFVFSPLFYWLPAWLAVCGAYACVHAQATGEARGAVFRRFLWKAWMPQGAGDVLFWLALTPWLFTLVCGVLGVAKLSTPWAIPIGYAFVLLWLRNLQALSPASSEGSIARWYKAWWWVVLVVLVCAPIVALWHAVTGETEYYRPTEESAHAMLQEWQARHPGQTLEWVGGEWTENANVAFYASPGLLTIPYHPESLGAQLAGIGDWRAKHGMLLCPLGPVAAGGQAEPSASPCVADAQAWLASKGLDTTPHVTLSHRSGWRFPHPQDFAYVVFDVPAQQAQP